MQLKIVIDYAPGQAGPNGQPAVLDRAGRVLRCVGGPDARERSISASPSPWGGVARSARGRRAPARVPRRGTAMQPLVQHAARFRYLAASDRGDDEGIF